MKKVISKILFRFKQIFCTHYIDYDGLYMCDLCSIKRYSGYNNDWRCMISDCPRRNNGI